MNKYGVENFTISLIEETDSPEEREMYWIEYYDTFGNGYNATKGGDGAKYLDYEKIIKTYQKIGCIKDTADYLSIYPQTVSKILKENHVNIIPCTEILKMKTSKPISMLDKENNLIMEFCSINEAARYMVNNHLTNCKLTTIKQHIHEVCELKRKTASGYKWKYKLTTPIISPINL